ncbi:MAG: glycosyltransferase family 4 protein, partial [Deltaproteobacteria bacterium]|nr:glycosyltransferase family 4 protein [Deltaproteobacteria bacterium]
PNGVDSAAWKSPPRPSDDRVRLVSVMRLDRRKRPLALIRIIHELRNRLSPKQAFDLNIIGDGPLYDAVKNSIHHLRLQDTVKLSGRQPRSVVKDTLARSDIFVLPSILESFGLSALEARAVGLPVAARSQGGVSEFIRHGREGILAESDADMAQWLLRLIMDSELRQAMARYNRETPPPHDWREVTARHLAIYRLAVNIRDRNIKPKPYPLSHLV